MAWIKLPHPDGSTAHVFAGSRVLCVSRYNLAQGVPDSPDYQSLIVLDHAIRIASHLPVLDVLALLEKK